MPSEPTLPSGLPSVNASPTHPTRSRFLLLIIPGVLVAAVLLFIVGGSGSTERDEVAEVIVYRSEVITRTSADSAQAVPPATSPTAIAIAANPTPIPVTGTFNPSDKRESIPPDCRARSSLREQNIILRAGPGTNHRQLAVLRPGDTLAMQARHSSGWYQVVLTTGGIAWVSNEVVRKEGNCEGLPSYDIPLCIISNNISGSANIRRAPSIDDDVIDALQEGDIMLADMQTADGWYRVQLASSTGWISSQVIALEGDCDALPHLPEASQETLDTEAIATTQRDPDTDCQVYSFTGDPVDLRAAPDVAAVVVGSLTSVQPASQRSTNGWFEVADDGWAFAADLRFEGVCSQLPTSD